MFGEKPPPPPPPYEIEPWIPLPWSQRTKTMFYVQGLYKNSTHPHIHSMPCPPHTITLHTAENISNEDRSGRFIGLLRPLVVEIFVNLSQQRVPVVYVLLSAHQWVEEGPAGMQIQHLTINQ